MLSPRPLPVRVFTHLMQVKQQQAAVSAHHLQLPAARAAHGDWRAAERERRQQRVAAVAPGVEQARLCGGCGKQCSARERHDLRRRVCV
jgi:hypothetical protein